MHLLPWQPPAIALMFSACLWHCHGDKARRASTLRGRLWPKRCAFCFQLLPQRQGSCPSGLTKCFFRVSNRGCKEDGAGSQGPGFKVLVIQQWANKMSFLWLSWFLMHAEENYPGPSSGSRLLWKQVRSYEKKGVLHFLEPEGLETTNQGKIQCMGYLQGSQAASSSH